jgi:hypothetical protein
LLFSRLIASNSGKIKRLIVVSTISNSLGLLIDDDFPELTLELRMLESAPRLDSWCDLLLGDLICSVLTLRLRLLCLRLRSGFSSRVFSTIFLITIRSLLRLRLLRGASFSVVREVTRVLLSRNESAGIDEISEPCCMYLELLSPVGINGLACRRGMTSISIGPPPLDVTFDSSVAERYECKL